MPFCTRQLVRVCRRSCQRKSSIPALSSAEYHAFVARVAGRRTHVHVMYMSTARLKKRVTMAAAVERIVVQATPQEKKAIMAKAKKLGLPISELMRRGATAYKSAQADEELGALADAAKAAADRAGASIDEALEFIAASNKRIAALESQAARARKKASG